MFKRYFKPTPKKLLRISLAMRTMIGTISGAAYFDGKKDAAFWFLIAGAVVDFLINCQTDDRKPSKPYIDKVLLILFGSIVLTSSCSRKVSETITISKTDSTWMTKKLVDIPVKGGATAGINMDSLKSLMEQYMMNTSGSNPSEITRIVEKTFSIPDTSGRYELRYWMDASGQLFAQCVGKDQVIQTLVEQNNRLIKEVQEKKKTVVKYRLPVWTWLGLGVVLAAILFTGLKFIRRV